MACVLVLDLVPLPSSWQMQNERKCSNRKVDRAKTDMAIIRYHNVKEIVGDILKVTIPRSDDEKSVRPRLDDIALVHTESGQLLLSQIIYIENQTVSLQIF